MTSLQGNIGLNRVEDDIDAFFFSFTEFGYDRTASPHDEFFRMSKFFNWPSRKYLKIHFERDKAWQGFRIALTRTFNLIFGSNVDNSEAWGQLCTILRASPVSASLEARREAAAKIHVNLVDLLICTRAGLQVHVFEREKDLVLYTTSTGKYFPKEEAYAGGILKYLLREIENKYKGQRGKTRGRYRPRK